LFIELDADDVFTVSRRIGGQTLFGRDAEEVVNEDQLATFNEERITAEARTLRKDDALAVDQSGRDLRGFARRRIF